MGIEDINARIFMIVGRAKAISAKSLPRTDGTPVQRVMGN
jgi:hypothetical protein